MTINKLKKGYFEEVGLGGVFSWRGGAQPLYGAY